MPPPPGGRHRRDGRPAQFPPCRPCPGAANMAAMINRIRPSLRLAVPV